MQGDLAAAGALFEGSLRIARDIAFHWGIAESLEGLAALAAVRVVLERALYLAGAAAAVREERGIAFSSASQADLVRRVEAAGRSLPAAVAAAASAAGRALPLPLVVDEALDATRKEAA